MRRSRLPLALGLLLLAVVVAVGFWLPTPAPDVSPDASAPRPEATPTSSSPPAQDPSPADTGGHLTPEQRADQQAKRELVADILALCPIELEWPADSAFFHQPMGDYGLGSRVSIRDGTVWLTVREPEGSGTLDVPDHDRIEISWADGACTVPVLRPPPLTATISGTVRHAAGEPEGDVWISGCGQLHLEPDVDGGFFFRARPEPCRLQALRKGGALHAWGEAAEVHPVAGEDTVVTLDLPPWRPAGLGLTIQEHDLGIAVLQVIEGTAAWRAGLREGDVVVEIDGEPTAAMELQTFVAWAVGQEGTVAELKVRSSDGTEELIPVERAPVEIGGGGD